MVSRSLDVQLSGHSPVEIAVQMRHTGRQEPEGRAGGLPEEDTISGGHNEGVPPVPIPNTEVKPFSAEST